MAVTITFPTSQIVDRSNGFTVSWTSDYPQCAFEVLYRLKGDTAWNSFGRTESTAQTVTYDASGYPDCTEYHYRVIVYADKTTTDDGETYYTGSDSSPAYSAIFVPNAQATMKVKGSTEMVEVPLYEGLNWEEPVLKVNAGGKYLQAAMVSRTSPIQSAVALHVGGVVRSPAGKYATCEATGVDGETDLRVDQKYAYNYTYYVQYTYYYSGSALYYYTDSGTYSYTAQFVGTYTYNTYDSYRYIVRKQTTGYMTDYIDGYYMAYNLSYKYYYYAWAYDAYYVVSTQEGTYLYEGTAEETYYYKVPDYYTYYGAGSRYYSDTGTSHAYKTYSITA